MLDTLQIICLLGIFYGGWRLGKFMENLRDGIIDLDKRLTKLEKDAVKITFNEPFSTQDEKRVIKPLTEGKVKSQIKTYEGELVKTQAPPPPKPLNKKRKKSVEDWEDEFDIGGHE